MLPPNDDDIACAAALGCEPWCDEARALGCPLEEEEEEEDQAFARICAVVEQPRRSERERQATKRFEEGWFGECLPRLSSALGVAAVTERMVR